MTDETNTDDLEKASIAYFKAVLKTGREIFGHPEFMFTIDCKIGTRPEDVDQAKVLGARIQKALDIAKAAAAPKVIEGTTL